VEILGVSAALIGAPPHTWRRFPEFRQTRTDCCKPGLVCRCELTRRICIQRSDLHMGEANILGIPVVKPVFHQRLYFDDLS
jgi:hypothetical protein